jgi:ABC-type transport system involved in multi-copper enzyme maturation permease subunit
MSRALVIAQHVLKESVRRRIFSVVIVLTALFLALFTIATIEAFNANSPFGGGGGGGGDGGGGGGGGLPVSQVTSVTLYGLGMFSVLFLAIVLAVFLTLGAVRGDAESGLLQPLVVRPLGRAELLLGRFAGAASVCVGYVLGMYAVVLLIVHQGGGRWPGAIVGPGLALAGAIAVIVALSLLGSVFLSAAANGIAMFMLYGAGLVAGLLSVIGHALGAPTVQTISWDISLALPFEALYQAGLHALGSNQTGLVGVLVNLGPFGSSHSGGIALDLWAVAYIAGAGALAVFAFGRRDL